jgi:hypothetical protein
MVMLVEISQARRNVSLDLQERSICSGLASAAKAGYDGRLTE